MLQIKSSKLEIHLDFRENNSINEEIRRILRNTFLNMEKFCALLMPSFLKCFN